jgi:hypothetical protein
MQLCSGVGVEIDQNKWRVDLTHRRKDAKEKEETLLRLCACVSDLFHYPCVTNWRKT